MNHKQIILFLFLILSLRTYGQALNSHKWDDVTIYKYGTPLTSCESNFDNLFNNWPKWITNYQQTKLVSYKYIETLEDSILIDYYAEIVINWKTLWCEISGQHEEKSNADTTIHIRNLYFYTKPFVNIPKRIKNDPSKMALYRSEINLGIKMMREHFKKTVHVGDKVYNIKLKIGGKEYDHYVICRPGENKVVFDMFFLGIHEMRETIDKFQ